MCKGVDGDLGGLHLAVRLQWWIEPPAWWTCTSERWDLQFFCHGIYSEAAKGGRRGDPFVPRWDTLPNMPALNKHSQTFGQLTPATGIPLVCLDDGGLLLSFAPALCCGAGGKAGYSNGFHIDSPTAIKLYLLLWNKNRNGDLHTL